MSRSTRFLALLQALRGRRHPVTAATLACELEVSERTIYRDLAELTSQGASIHGQAGIGYVLGPDVFLPPLTFTEDETEAVLLGLRYVHQRGDEVLKKAGSRARAKIIAILTSKMMATASAPLSAPGPDGVEFPENTVSLAILRSAIRSERRIAIRYTDGQTRGTQRTIWPIQLGFMDSARVLTGWCELRAAFRFFRTDRIGAADLLDRYPARRADLLAAFLREFRADPRSLNAPDRI